MVNGWTKTVSSKNRNVWTRNDDSQRATVEKDRGLKSRIKGYRLIVESQSGKFIILKEGIKKSTAMTMAMKHMRSHPRG